MRSVSPKLRLSAAHLFSGVAIECSIGEAEVPDAPVYASIRFISETNDPVANVGLPQEVGLCHKSSSEEEFLVSVAADSTSPGRYLISCYGQPDPDRHQLDRCYREALLAADNAGALVALVPVLSAGATPEDRVRTAVRAVRHLSNSFEHLRSIRFIASDERAFKAFRQRLAKQSGRSRVVWGNGDSAISGMSG